MAVTYACHLGCDAAPTPPTIRVRRSRGARLYAHFAPASVNLPAPGFCHCASSTAVFSRQQRMPLQVAWLIKTNTALAHKDLRKIGTTQKSRRKHRRRKAL